MAARRFTLPPELRNDGRIGEALSAIRERWPGAFQAPGGRHDSPVFVLSAGMRAGSTLVQRLLISSGELFVWGEPLGEAALVPRLCAGLGTIDRAWPKDSYFEHPTEISAVSRSWIANLTPDLRYLWNSHRALLMEWLAKPADEKFGIPRWGLKETRLSIEHARYLKWLFPEARFVFVYRNPFHSFASLKGLMWRGIWPGYHPSSPVAFARNWRKLVVGFLNGHHDVDGCMIKFEDLIGGRVSLADIASHIGVRELDPEVLKTRVSLTAKGSSSHHRKLNPYDRLVIRTVCGPVLDQLGYRPS